MPMFVLTCDHMPNIFIKAKDEDAALNDFKDGFGPDEEKQFTNHPSFKCRPFTMELFDSLTPDEFTISECTSF